MSRVLLSGRAGAGKTHFCLDALLEVLNAGKRPLLLVPTYSQAEHLRTLLLDRTGGISSAAIHTFTSLAEAAAGQRLNTLVSAPARDRVAAEVLSEHFAEAAGQAGFRAEFLAAVKELKEQGEPVGDALEKARAHFAEGSRGRRLFVAYASYVAVLAERGPDHEDLLLRTREHFRQKEPEPLDHLLVDGFFDFTPVQRDILDLLAENAAETTVTLPLHPVSARTVESFAGYERRELAGNRRAAGALAEIERSLFAGPDPKQPAEGVEVIACASEEDEADRLARIVVASGRPYQDFLIVRRGFDGLHGLYRAAFRRHGVPLRFFGGEPLGRIPAARAVMAWLRRGSLSLTEQLPMLRSPYLEDGPEPSEVDRLARRLRKQGEAGALDEFPSIRHTLERDDLVPFGLKDAIVGCPDGDEDLARAGAFFSRLREELKASRDPEHLLRRIPLLKGAVRDRRRDCVQAVGARDARQWEKPVVMVAGLTADAFPQQVSQDIFLRDEERRAFGQERGLHLPLRKRREEEERYLFYVAATRASERLVLTYPAFDEQGTPRPPSPYLEQLRGFFEPELKPREIPLSAQFVQPRDAVADSDLLPIVADGLRHQLALALSLHDRAVVPRETLAWPRRLEVLRTRPVADIELKHLSPTGIQAFVRCPFLFFASRILGVKPTREFRLDPMTLGGIAHTALERFVKERGDCGALFDEAFSAATEGMRLGIDDEASRIGMRYAVTRAAARIDLDAVLEPEKTIKPVIEGVTLYGRIDRIDSCGDGKLIVDYKTGRSGDELQLDCYLLAEEGAVGAVFDWIKDDRFTGFVREGVPAPKGKIEVLSEVEFEQRKQGTRDRIRDVAERVRAGRVAVHPDDPEKCTRGKCDAYDLCRVARGRWLAKAARA